ncbi:MAG: hypothetical protein MI923_19585 [Phycisphaerales bacterium]|nr:hypothetical protein [Phycisphaerales bacterium]
MSASPERSKCIKRGLVLTCYVDGRKRFRAISINANGQGTTPRAISDAQTERTTANARVSAPIPTRRRGQ